MFFAWVIVKPYKFLILLTDNEVNRTMTCCSPIPCRFLLHLSTSEEIVTYCLNTFRQAIATKFSDDQLEELLLHLDVNKSYF